MTYYAANSFAVFGEVGYTVAEQVNIVERLDRITRDPQVMGGKACVRGMRITVGTIVGLVASGKTSQEILELYPYLEEEDIRQSLAFAAWRAEEIEVLLGSD